MKKIRQSIKALRLCALFTALLMLLCGCTLPDELQFLLSDAYFFDAPSGEPDGQLTLEFLYVGQADCTLIRFPSGETMLVDGGNDADGDGIADYLLRRGIDRLDYVVGTHPHEDHIGGLDKIISRLSVGAVYAPELPDNLVPDTRNYADFLSAAQDSCCGVTYLSAGERLYTADALAVDCLSPDSRDVFSDLNNYSIVLRITYGEDAFLLMGDAEQTVEKILLREGCELQADLLKVGHHGSHSSSGGRFLRVVDPDYAVISCGVDNSYGFPHTETMDALAKEGAQVYVLSTVGSVTATSHGDGITVQSDAGLLLDAA